MSDNNNYVAAWHDYASDKVIVLERTPEGELVRKRYNLPYYFYVPAEEAEPECETIFGDKVIRAEFENKFHYEAAKKHYPVKFESDIPPVKRVLMDYYYGKPTPPIRYAFIDIEVDYRKKLKFAGPKNPYGIINAVTVWQSWTNKYFVATVPPKGWTGSLDTILAKAEELKSQGHLDKESNIEIHICKDELELIDLMLKWLSGTDIISGWNSELYDLPYICERLLLNGGERLLQKLDHPGTRTPTKEMIKHFGSEEAIWKLSGKCHLDYMKCFQKFTFEGRVSYSLGSILNEEVGVGKLDHDPDFEKFYFEDYENFVCYNFRDVEGLVQLDKKFRFIALVNEMAHDTTVHFEAIMGTVAYVETAMINYAHQVMGKVVNDKYISIHDKVEGAIVISPKVDIHPWTGSVDINALYPSTARMLNLSPEMIIGQFPQQEEAFKAIRDETDDRLVCIFEDGEQKILTAKEWKALFIEQKWAISAFGTILDQSRGLGLIPSVFQHWAEERDLYKAAQKDYEKKADATSDPDKKKFYEAEAEQQDLLQLTAKIKSNSAYGATLNPHFRLGRECIGASITGSGRYITTHMAEEITEQLTGIRTPLVKTTILNKDGEYENVYTSESPVIISGDTDSVYFRTNAQDKEEAIKIADAIATEVNRSFEKFTRETFLVQPGYDQRIKAVREIVAERAIWIAKKKYSALVVDEKGKSCYKIKSMGSEIKKADTPKLIQKFLEKVTMMILSGENYDDVATFINEQRKEILKNKDNVFLLGVSKRANNLDQYLAEYLNPGTIRSNSGGKLTIPGHIRSAFNFNAMLDRSDPGTKPITSGDKVLIYYLKPNQFGFKAIALPSDATRFPFWFTENFTVDIEKTEDRMFDSKMSGIFNAWGHEVPTPQSVFVGKLLNF